MYVIQLKVISIYEFGLEYIYVRILTKGISYLFTEDWRGKKMKIGWNSDFKYLQLMTEEILK